MRIAAALAWICMSLSAALYPGAVRGEAISAGYGHSCKVLHDAKVACWGANNTGQLGIDVRLR